MKLFEFLSDYGVYKFSVDCGKLGKFESVMIEAHKVVQCIKGTVVALPTSSCECCLEEELEIWVELNEDTVGLISDDETFVVDMYNFLGREVGYNPLSYLYEEASPYLAELIRESRELLEQLMDN